MKKKIIAMLIAVSMVLQSVSVMAVPSDNVRTSDGESLYEATAAEQVVSEEDAIEDNQALDTKKTNDEIEKIEDISEEITKEEIEAITETAENEEGTDGDKLKEDKIYSDYGSIIANWK